MKTLVQIGLNQTCEYIYVAEPNWPSLKDLIDDREFPFIPEELWEDGEAWNYYGVDMSDHSINVVSAKYGDLPNVHFIKALIYGSDTEEVKNNAWTVGRGGIIQKTMSLATLFRTTGYPNVLIMDVEDSEYVIFNGYDFQHKPEIIMLETHSHKSYHATLKILLNQGYVLLDYFQGASNRSKVVGLLFMHEDIISDRIKGLWVYPKKK